MMLEDLNADVTAVSTVDAGFQELHNRRWDLIITDVRTPGCTNGLELAIAARSQQPGAGVIVMSGYYAEIGLPLPPEVYFLAKPWALDEFYALVAVHLT